jgi:hypothetical protein
VATLDNHKPIAGLQVADLTPHDFPMGIHDGNGVIVGRFQPQTELSFDRVDLCNTVVLCDEGMGKPRPIENLIASEVLPESRGI